jgi:hypothetical protein
MAPFVVFSAAALIMDSDVDHSVGRCCNVIARWHALPGLAGPARLDPVGRQVVVSEEW